MKVKRLSLNKVRIPALYPTWFRWKMCFFNFSCYFFRLYIPHGSDESVHALMTLCRWAHFISHMVQMKVKKSLFIFSLFYSFISHMVQMKAGGNFLDNSSCSLYIPHGSDERSRVPSKRFFLKCFISHMVQMKGLVSLPSSFWLITLYPTWFRWKRLYKTTVCWIAFLYIPHGSDESEELRVVAELTVAFISHMVQMKVQKH